MMLGTILILAFAMVLLFSLDPTVSAFGIEEVVMLDSGIGLKVIHLVGDFKIYGCPAMTGIIKISVVFGGESTMLPKI